MNIVITSFSRLPDGDAEAVRLMNFAKLFRSMGHDVVCLGTGAFNNYLPVEYDHIPVISIRLPGRSFITRLYNLLSYPFRLYRFLRDMHLTKEINCILCADISNMALFGLKIFSKKYKSRLVCDAIEWYSPNQFKLGNLDYRMISKNIEMRSTLDKHFRIIAISSYLNRHFQKKGVPTWRIPVLMDVENTSCYKNDPTEKLVIIYAGSPGKKDFFKEILEGFSMLNQEQLDRISFKIIGATKAQVIENSGIDPNIVEKLGDILLFLGRMPRSEVLKHYEDADFSVLVRSTTQRYAKAGFPTKVVESLASATPVMLNLTSDLGEYIVDGRDGFIINELTAQEIKGTLVRALELSKDDRLKMRNAARECAEKNFDYRLYEDIMTSIID